MGDLELINKIYLYSGSALIILWGLVHLILTMNIIRGFGEVSADNKKVLMMQVIGEGLTLIFLGALPLVIIFLGLPLSVNGFLVYRTVGGMLLAMALLALFTSARVPVTWYKVCPAVKTVAAALFIVGSLV